MSLPTYWYQYDREGDDAATTQWPFVLLVVAIMIAIVVALAV